MSILRVNGSYRVALLRDRTTLWAADERDGGSGVISGKVAAHPLLGRHQGYWGIGGGVLPGMGLGGGEVPVWSSDGWLVSRSEEGVVKRTSRGRVFGVAVAMRRGGARGKVGSAGVSAIERKGAGGSGGVAVGQV